MDKESSKELLLDSLNEAARGGLPDCFARLSLPDWNNLLDLTEEFGLGPVLYSILQQAHVPLPDSVETDLQQRLLDNTARNLHQLAVFSEISGVLHQADIRFIPLKGLYLAGEIYPQMGWRVMEDIDILVRPSDLEATRKAVESLGYRPERPYSLEAERRTFHHLPNYLRPGSPSLEIHHQLLMPIPQFHCDMAAVWGRAVLQTSRLGSAYILCPEDMLLYLCAHIAYHHLYVGSVRSLLDIRWFILRTGSSLDWTVVAGRAREWGVLPSLYLTLRLVETTLGPLMPEGVRSLLRPHEFDEGLIRAAQAKFFSHQELSRTLVMVWERKNIFQRVGGVINRVFLPPDVLAQKYRLHPRDRRLVLYYFVRLKDLLRNYSREVLNLFRRDTETFQRANADGLLIKYLGWMETR